MSLSLLDHFHPPLSERRHWHSFHNAWATYLSSDLNQRLPEGWFAEANVQFGIEIDVAAFEEGDEPARSAPPCTPGSPTSIVPFAAATDVVEVLVYSREGGPTVVGAIELVSPANKDRAAHRRAFVSKCESYLCAGIGLLVVDVVTSRKKDLHRLLLRRVAKGAGPRPARELYAVSYRPVEREGAPSLEMWEEALTLGAPLPEMPLWLKGWTCVATDLGATYERTCREQRLA